MDGLAMSKRLPESDFKWLEGIYEFNEIFVKSYNEGCFLQGKPNL